MIANVQNFKISKLFCIANVQLFKSLLANNKLFKIPKLHNYFIAKVQLLKTLVQWNAEIRMFGFWRVPKAEQNGLPFPDVPKWDIRFIRTFGFRTDQ